MEFLFPRRCDRNAWAGAKHPRRLWSCRARNGGLGRGATVCTGGADVQALPGEARLRSAAGSAGGEFGRPRIRDTPERVPRLTFQREPGGAAWIAGTPAIRLPRRNGRGQIRPAHRRCGAVRRDTGQDSGEACSLPDKPSRSPSTRAQVRSAWFPDRPEGVRACQAPQTLRTRWACSRRRRLPRSIVPGAITGRYGHFGTQPDAIRKWGVSRYCPHHSTGTPDRTGRPVRSGDQSGTAGTGHKSPQRRIRAGDADCVGAQAPLTREGGRQAGSGIRGSLHTHRRWSVSGVSSRDRIQAPRGSSRHGDGSTGAHNQSRHTGIRDRSSQRAAAGRGKEQGPGGRGTRVDAGRRHPQGAARWCIRATGHTNCTQITGCARRTRVRERCPPSSGRQARLS